mgnify:CR=1 FL=1
MYRMLNSLVNLLVTFIAIWATFVAIECFLGVTIIFPFTFVEAQSIPYHRWQPVRIAVFLTVTYFSVLHLWKGDRDYQAIYFLEIYLKILTIVGLVIFYRVDVVSSEYFVLLFFGFFSLVLHLARIKRYKYFSKR